jgi:cytochrome d ubiquinol oxidase subunit I
LVSLGVFCAVYALIFVFGIVYIHKLLRAGPQGRLVAPVDSAATRRPMSIVDGPLPAPEHSTARSGMHSPSAPK